MKGKNTRKEIKLDRKKKKRTKSRERLIHVVNYFDTGERLDSYRFLISKGTVITQEEQCYIIKNYLKITEIIN